MNLSEAFFIFGTMIFVSKILILLPHIFLMSTEILHLFILSTFPTFLLPLLVIVVLNSLIVAASGSHLILVDCSVGSFVFWHWIGFLFVFAVCFFFTLLFFLMSPYFGFNDIYCV